ncbi:MAG TPA: lipopolysaccharide biosynthesis protein [Nitrospira sp.]|nr:lipopolysaccharide biosynthesis protein [Nitrospira sp.]
MFKPALLIIAGRVAGYVAAFVIPLIVVRIFDLETFGTYKQWFLLYITLLTVTQIGMSESLLYFLPRGDGSAGRYVMNSMLFLTGAGAAVAVILACNAEVIARWMSNPALEPLIPLLAWYLLLMQMSIGLETVMTARGAYRSAAVAYAATDVTRALFLLMPVLVMSSLQALLYGAVAFAGLRLAFTIRYFWRTFGTDLRPDAPSFRRQLAYALPFALAVVASVAQENLHQYAVSAFFDAATFAVYAVGCLQIPVVDVVATTVCNVMMVGMTTAIHEGRESQVIDLWHDAVRKLALVFVPLTVLLVIIARDVIVMLFTEAYAASVPIFMVSAIAILFAAIPIDGLLRVYAKTQVLLVINLVRLAMIALLIQWTVGAFGLVGAVLVTVLALAVGKTIGLAAAGSLWQVAVRRILPWGALSLIVSVSLAAALPALAVSYGLQAPPFIRLLLVGAVYGSAYAAMALGFGLVSARERAALSEAMGRLQFVLPVRYQHKPS